MEKEREMKLREIVEQFEIAGNIEAVMPLGNGLINDTFRVKTEGEGPDYVLQRINHNIFQNVEGLQNNIDQVTNHIRMKLQATGTPDVERRCLRFVKARGSEKSYLFDGESYWRVSVMIPDAVTKEAVIPENAYAAGLGFGEFEKMLADVPGELVETIPDFHNMEFRIEQFLEAIAENRAGRLDEVKEIADELLSKVEYGTTAERLHREGVLPKRICHCDTKVNNMLFDGRTEGRDMLCVIDLDTVMPAFVFSDFGDFLRTAANFVAEDDPNTAAVGFNMEIFKSFAKGYVESTREFLTPAEKELLPYAAFRFAYMQAVRFFTDYLNGDTYYKIFYPDHNLVRTRNQVALMRSIEANLPEMQAYINSL